MVKLRHTEVKKSAQTIINKQSHNMNLESCHRAGVPSYDASSIISHILSLAFFWRQHMHLSPCNKIEEGSQLPAPENLPATLMEGKGE